MKTANFDDMNLDQILDHLNSEADDKKVRGDQKSFLHTIRLTVEGFKSRIRNGLYKLNDLYNVDGKITHVNDVTQFYIELHNNPHLVKVDKPDEENGKVIEYKGDKYKLAGQEIEFDINMFLDCLRPLTVPYIWNTYGKFTSTAKDRISPLKQEPIITQGKNGSKTRRAYNAISVDGQQQQMVDCIDVRSGVKPVKDYQYTPSKYQADNPDLFQANDEFCPVAAELLAYQFDFDKPKQDEQVEFCPVADELLKFEFNFDVKVDVVEVPVKSDVDDLLAMADSFGF